MELGEFSARTVLTIPNAPFPPITSAVDSGIKVKSGWSVSGVGILPLGDFSLFARLGVHNLKAVGGVVNVDVSGRSTAAVYGLGLGYDVSPRLGLRAEWERYTKVGDADTIGIQDADLLSAGVVFRF